MTITKMLLAGKSFEEIRAEHPQLTASTVRTYIARARAALTPEQRAALQTPRARSEYHQRFQARAEISEQHGRIGRKILRLRVKDKLSHREFAAHYGFSNHVALSAMEQGFHDFKLSELVMLSDILDMPIEELFNSNGDTVNGSSSERVLSAHPDTPHAAGDSSPGRH